MFFSALSPSTESTEPMGAARPEVATQLMKTPTRRDFRPGKVYCQATRRESRLRRTLPARRDSKKPRHGSYRRSAPSGPATWSPTVVAYGLRRPRHRQKSARSRPKYGWWASAHVTLPASVRTDASVGLFCVHCEGKIKYQGLPFCPRDDR
jgi:hypothetical protein